MIPLYFGGSSLWVAFDEWLVKVSYLGKLASVFWWWSWISSIWSAMKCTVVSFELSMVLVRLLTTCISVLRIMFLHCWRISLECLALNIVGSWVELGFSVGMEAFG